MPNYKNSKIYQLWSPSNLDLVYIGSTTQTLSLRMGQHRSKYKQYLNGTYNYVSSFKVLECPDARIELIEEVKCESRAELHKIEGKYIRERDCVNKVIAGRTMKEYHQEHKEKRNEYNRQYSRQYRRTHKEEIKEYDRQYYKDNKQQIKEKRSVKIDCDCGSSVSKQHISTHRRTKKHQQYLESLQ